MFEQVKGFLDKAEGEALYALSRKAGKRGPCLEIGSYCGKSTICIGTACRETHSTLFTIDQHTGSEEQQPGEEYFDPDLFNYQTFQVDTLTGLMLFNLFGGAVSATQKERKHGQQHLRQPMLAGADADVEVGPATVEVSVQPVGEGIILELVRLLHEGPGGRLED